MTDELAYKIIVIGDAGVGKSNLASRYCDDAFYDNEAPTIGMDFKYCHSTTLKAPQRSVAMQLWDTSGQDRFATLTTAFYRNCNGVILCFDLTNRVTFDNLDAWYSRLEANCTKVPPLVLVGCKQDLSLGCETGDGITLGSWRQVERSEADTWARRHDCLVYLETSAKRNTNVTELFQQLATYLAQNSAPTVEGGRKPVSGRPLRKEETRRDRGCCTTM